MHILLNISRIKGNQKMKFGQLIEYNQGNIFRQKSCRKWSRETSSISLLVFFRINGKYGGKTIPRPFSEKSKLSISLDQ